MSITDELREVAAKTECANGRCEKLYRGDLEHIADRIDAEHQKCIDAMWEDAKSHLSDESLTELGWIRLPKDADGEYIHVGDVMEWCDSGDTLEVIGIGDDTLFYVDPEGDHTYAEWTAARNKRHYHAPTVEDVLREFANEVYADADNEIRDRDFLCAKYAKRLTLAEGEDA